MQARCDVACHAFVCCVATLHCTLLLHCTVLLQWTMLLLTLTNKASADVMMTDLHPLWGTAGGASPTFSIPNPEASWGCPALRFSGSTSHSSPSGYTGVGSDRHTMVPSSSTSWTVEIHHAFCQKPCHSQHNSDRAAVHAGLMLRVCAACDTDHCRVDCSRWQRSATSTIL